MMHLKTYNVNNYERSLTYSDMQPGLDEYLAEGWERMIYGGVLVEQVEHNPRSLWPMIWIYGQEKPRVRWTESAQAPWVLAPIDRWR